MIVKNYSGNGSITEETSYMYLISFEVSPGSSSSGCDLKFKTYIGKSTPLLDDTDENATNEYEVTWGETMVSDMILKKTKEEYGEVCILFEKITQKSDGTCLYGISEGEYLCNKIVDSTEKVYTDEDFETQYAP